MKVHDVAPAAGAPRDQSAAPERIEVRHAGGEAYAIGIRQHTVLVDQPAEAGGDDRAATPAELFVASLASCVAFYAGRYLSRHGLPRDGLLVTAEYTMATDRPARVAAVYLSLTAPGLPPDREAGLLAVASHCTVHNSLLRPPELTIELSAT